MSISEQITEALERTKRLGDDHEPEGWTAIQMHYITLMLTEMEEMQGLLLWALWHAQGASSPVGQPIRKFMGIGPHEALTVGEVHHAIDVVTKLS